MYSKVVICDFKQRDCNLLEITNISTTSCVVIHSWPIKLPTLEVSRLLGVSHTKLITRNIQLYFNSD